LKGLPPYSFSPFHRLCTEPLSRETFVASSGRLAIANRAQGEQLGSLQRIWCAMPWFGVLPPSEHYSLDYVHYSLLGNL
jgi:hypothetical protein